MLPEKKHISDRCWGTCHNFRRATVNVWYDPAFRKSVRPLVLMPNTLAHCDIDWKNGKSRSLKTKNQYFYCVSWIVPEIPACYFTYLKSSRCQIVSALLYSDAKMFGRLWHYESLQNRYLGAKWLTHDRNAASPRWVYSSEFSGLCFAQKKRLVLEQDKSLGVWTRTMCCF